jgi:predicted dehydrogenase
MRKIAMKEQTHVTRREFLKHAAAAGVVVVGARLGPRFAGAQEEVSAGESGKKIKVGVIGCGSVSRHYLRDLTSSPFVELVSCCDRIYERAKRAASEYGVPHHYPNIREMLAGAEFDLLVNLTDMQEHYRLNKEALQAGKHVWSEKPIAGNYEEGMELLDLAKKHGVRLWGSPTVVTSPQFAFMAKTLAAGTLGRIAAAHASYGHLGPNWSPFFYQKGGGSLPDLGVYNITTLTALLGPAKEVVAMTSIVTPTRDIRGRALKVEAEDNAMLVMDHGNSILSHVQCGFNYFTPFEHDATRQNHHTIAIIGTGGSMHLAGYDWAPHGVDLATHEQPKLQRHASDTGNYTWQYGASHVAECLCTGKDSLITPEHAVHVAEIIHAANESQGVGRRIAIRSSFRWPIIG